MGLPKSGNVLSQSGGIRFLAPMAFLPNAGHFHRGHSLNMKPIQNSLQNIRFGYSLRRTGKGIADTAGTAVIKGVLCF